MDEDMTQTKLEIIGPYTPEHPGPFCTRNGRSVRIVTKVCGSDEFPIIGIVKDKEQPDCWQKGGLYLGADQVSVWDLMNAREVPVPREFWVNKYKFRELSGAYPTKGMADSFSGRDRVECIHVREVMPGEE